jgi:hypothetical protein
MSGCVSGRISGSRSGSSPGSRVCPARRERQRSSGSPARIGRRASALATLPALALGALALGVLALGGCAGGLVQAPFPARPDTVVPGRLDGPFDGVVLDQATNEPVAGALVLASWAFESPRGLLSPSASYSTSVVTEIDGTYRLPALPKAQSHPSSLLRRFTLVVYKAGYLGYRSDLRTDDRTPRHDFAQRGNTIRLDRFPQGESHARHLVFLGAGGLLQRAAQAEGKQAALELTEASPAPPADPTPEPAAAPEEAPPPPLAAKVLERADVAPLFAQSGASGEPALEALAPLPPPLETGASGVRYAVPAPSGGEGAEAGGPEIALRLWRLSSGAEARALFDRMKARPAGSTSPSPAPIQLAAPKSRPQAPIFSDVPATNPPLRDGGGTAHTLPAAASAAAKPFSVDGALRSYDPAVKARAIVVLVTRLGLVLHLRCDEALCKDDAAAQSLINLALSRL